MIITALALLILIFSYFILSPFWDAAYGKKLWIAEQANTAELKLRKQEILAALNDLEYDLQLKKITPEDYREVKASLMNSGIEVMQAIDRTNGSKAKPQAAHPSPKKRSRSQHVHHTAHA